MNNSLTPRLSCGYRRWTGDAFGGAHALDHPLHQRRRPGRVSSSRQCLLRDERPSVGGTKERMHGHGYAARTQLIKRGQQRFVSADHALIGDPLDHDTLAAGTDGEPRPA